MITRAIVEEVLTPFKVRVRIPLLNRLANTPLATKKEDLDTAVICSLPSCYVNIKEGDIVFVAFEDNVQSKVVVLGHLSMEGVTSYASISLNELCVASEAKLPSNTTIGDNVSSFDLTNISGTKDNLQKQINLLNDKIDNLTKLIEGDAI